jgi:hypothetical protein
MTPWQDVIRDVWKSGKEKETWTVDQVMDQLFANQIYSANPLPKFIGTLYCEACLISLLEDSRLENILSGVSRPLHFDTTSSCQCSGWA